MPSDYDQIRRDNIREYGKGTRHLAFLGRLYTDRTHFIFELLQNAEDAGAARVLFELSGGMLEVKHDGRPFNELDVRGVCGVGEGTKSEDLTQIGKFGIGFKSVYAYTSTPEVHSGDEHFRIEHYVRPYPAEPKETGKSWTTLFSFTFGIPPVDAETAYSEIAGRLRNLSTRTLLFLRKIKEIEYRLSDGTSGAYLRGRVHRGSGRQVTVIGQNNGEEEDENWLVFEKPVPVPNRDYAVKVEVAFKLDTDVKEKSERIMRIKDAPLVVYFPTEKSTRFGFLIQGPYRTTPSRDNIPKDDDWNATLVKETAALLTEALLSIKNMGLLTVSLLESMPIRMDDFPEDSMFFPIPTSVRDAFLHHELLPADDGTFVVAQNVKIARGAELRKLLSHKQLRSLFQSDDEVKWLVGTITQDRTPDLRTYLLNELDIEEITPDGFSRKLSGLFLSNQSDEWFIKFYRYLLGQEALWRPPRWSGDARGVLRNKPIIRLQDNTHVKPFRSDGTPNSFLPPPEDTDFPTVKRQIFGNEQAAEFLRNLGLSEPDLIDDIVERVLPKYTQPNAPSVSENENLNDVQKILRAMASDSKAGKKKVVHAASETPFLQTVDQNKITSFKGHYHKPTECFLDLPYEDTGLDALFNCQEIDLEKRKLPVSNKYFKIKGFKDFAKDIGVMYELEIREHKATEMQKTIFPRIGRKTDTTIDKDYYLNALKGGWYCDGSDYYLGLLDLKKHHIELSLAVWKTLCRAEEKKLSAFYRPNDANRNKEKRAHSFLIDQLKNCSWIPDKNSRFRLPQDVTKESLHSGFPFDNQNGWLDAIGLGENVKKANDEYLVRNNQARRMGFVSAAEADKMIELASLCRQWGKSPDEFISQLAHQRSLTRSEFPTRSMANPDRRRDKLSQQIDDAPEKKYEQRDRSVRTTRGAVDPDLWLRNQYKNESGQIICQVCKEEMPFRKRDGEHYFEAVEALSRDYFTKEHEAQFLALCPLCAAMYKEFVRQDEGAMVYLKNALVNTDDSEVPLRLGKKDTSIRFVETHYNDIKTILKEQE